MPNENSSPGQKRTYRQKKRAHQQEETRERIVEAIVALHRTVGPARTKVTEIARKAGVGRMTVYNHFPTEGDLIGACSSHWIARNPPPDASAWQAVGDPGERLHRALAEMYAYYAAREDMLGNVMRDLPLVLPLAEVMNERWTPMLHAMVEVLLRGRKARGEHRTRLTAALHLVIDFSTWRTLTDAGLDTKAAATLAADLVSGC